jgi:hypothetical protein
MSWRRAPLTRKSAEPEAEQPGELPWWHWSIPAGRQLEHELCKRQGGPRRVAEREEPCLEPKSFSD